MGNKLCKSKKSDVVDNTQNNLNNNNNNNRSPSKFDRIINRLHLKPATWKSESHLNKKEGIRSKSEERKNGESIFYTKPLSKSTDWTTHDLEVPSKEDEHIHLRNPKLTLMFDNENGTPTPPPRKQQRSSNFKEKIEKIAKSTLQAVQGDKNEQTNKVPIEEPLCKKREINYKCPLCDSDEKNHNRDHHHHGHAEKQDKTNGNSTKNEKNDSSKKSKDDKRKKNLSVVSLPNYTDLKFSVADSEPLRPKADSKNDMNSSRLSLRNSESKKLTSSQSTGKLDTYFTRCRSFGSILPQQIKKLMPQKPKPAVVTSDDSFGALEDWDVGLIEHYNPKDASLPRPRKSLTQKTQKDVLSDIESLIVKEEDIEPQKPKAASRNIVKENVEPQKSEVLKSKDVVKEEKIHPKIQIHKPKAPSRKVESLVKRFNKESSKEAHLVHKAPEDVCLTPPPSPVDNKRNQSNLTNYVSIFEREFPSSPNKTPNDSEDFSSKTPYVAKILSPKEETSVKAVTVTKTVQNNTNKKEEQVEHSSLMRILQEFSSKDKQQEKFSNVGNDSNLSSLTPSLVEFEKNLNSNSLVEDFINAEKSHTRALYS